MKKLNNVFLLFFLILSLLCGVTSIHAQTLSKGNDKPYIILISGDGFRYDYAEKYQAKNLIRLSAQGVKAKWMIPSYPTVTHPNHYALVTGLYPGHSGILGNNFYDPTTKRPYNKNEKRWFQQETIWETEDKQNIKTANINWVNGQVAVAGLKNVYQYKKKKDVTTEERIIAILDWLALPEDKRPHLITLYFNNTDHAGHESGPDSEKTRQAVQEIDDAIGQIAAAVEVTKLPVNYIFVSDHGMIGIHAKDRLPIPAVVDTAKFVVNNQNAMVNLYAKDPLAVQSFYEKLKAESNPGYKVYLNDELPAELHLGGKDHRFNRAGDIILIPIWPKTFNPKAAGGVHGFAPGLQKEMGGTFIAWGPAFKKGLVIEPFENVEIYGLLTSMLGLKPASNDGKGELAGVVLK
jgi:predicted AlkP superfamily pyrophosphatase or phosphodiesterase